MTGPAALRIANSATEFAPGLVLGDIVRTGESRYPQYEIIAISEARAWVRDVQYGDDHVVPLAGLRRIFG